MLTVEVTRARKIADGTFEVYEATDVPGVFVAGNIIKDVTPDQPSGSHRRLMAGDRCRTKLQPGSTGARLERGDS
jgi:hypothetical protein